MGRKVQGEDKEEELQCGLTGCPETAVAPLGLGGIEGAESPLNLGGDADCPV